MPDARGVLAVTTPTVEFADAGVQLEGKRLLGPLSFRVEPGETMVLLGESGSGKTTALRLINRLLDPSEGRVLVEGRVTVEWEPVPLRRRIGYVIQDVGLLPHQWAALIVTTIILAGLCVWIIGWEEGGEEEEEAS